MTNKEDIDDYGEDLWQKNCLVSLKDRPNIWIDLEFNWEKDGDEGTWKNLVELARLEANSYTYEKALADKSMLCAFGYFEKAIPNSTKPVK